MCIRVIAKVYSRRLFVVMVVLKNPFGDDFVSDVDIRGTRTLLCPRCTWKVPSVEPSDSMNNRSNSPVRLNKRLEMYD